MDDTTLKALAGVATALVGGLIGAFVAAFNARHKIRELELKHAYTLKENYLSNARDYTQSLYVPLSMALTGLSEAFYEFRKSVDSGAETPEEAKSAFRTAISSFLESVDAIITRGGAAFLTNDLETSLLSFRNFLRSSRDADDQATKVVITYSFRLFGSDLSSSRTFTAAGKLAQFWMGSFGISQLGIGARVSGDEVLYAPIDSKIFEERFMRDTTGMNYMVKEVTLGSHAD